MTGLYIFLGIILFFVLIFTLKIKVILIMPSPEEMRLKLKIGVIPITILPKKEKKIKLSRYSKKEMEKRRLAEIENAKKKAAKKEAKKQKKEEKKRLEQERLEKLRKEGKLSEKDEKEKKDDPTAITLPDNINSAVASLGKFFFRFGRRFRIDVTRIIINVATGDAATTAVMYGATVPAVRALIALLEKTTNLKGLDKAIIDVRCDFLSEKTTVDVHIAFSMRPWHLFDMLFSALFAFLKKRKEIQNEKMRMHTRRKLAAARITAKMNKKADSAKSADADK